MSLRSWRARLQRWVERRIEKKRGEFRYGDDRTIHGTGEVNVERDEITGKVVSVWYRCALVPFTDTVVETSRSLEMIKAYKEYPPRQIRAIVFEEPSLVPNNNTPPPTLGQRWQKIWLAGGTSKWSPWK